MITGYGMSGKSTTLTTTALDESNLGPCSRDRYMEYFIRAGEMAPISAGQGRNMSDPDLQSRIVAAFEAYDFDPDTTYFVAAHTLTGEIFPSACADTRCSDAEFFEADQACLRKHLGNCGYIAAIFEGTTYCLIDPTG